ncbi:MAG TPA: DUF2971 domain-containing protein [Gammaproteobacteria bacterium]|nr:DUF2971 domain-containing protein [Gammaproteobacteria bacterium]
MPEELPDILYKYRDFNLRAVADMASNRLFLSSPQRFNDAFDGKIPWSEFLSPNELREIVENGGPFATQLRELRETRPEIFTAEWQLSDEGWLHVRDLLAEQFSSVSECGICSLSAVADDLRMWAHYGDSRQGFCLGFSTAHPPFDRAVPVRYLDRLHEVDAYKVLSGTLEEREAREYLVTKSAIWKDEREYRIIADAPDSHARYPEEAVRNITFGDRTPIEHMLIAHGVLPAHVEFFVISPTGGGRFELIAVDRDVLERYR